MKSGKIKVKTKTKNEQTKTKPKYEYVVNKIEECGELGISVNYR